MMKDKMIEVSKLICVVLLSTILIHCQRSSKPSEYLGPGILPAQSGFKISTFVFTTTGLLFQDSTANKVPTSKAAYIIAKFNQNVSWSLTIKGLSSGAQKGFTGVSEKLDSTNNIWRGESTNENFFSAEKVRVSLKVDGYDSVYTTVQTIQSAYNYDARIINGVKTTIVDDIEGEYTYSFFSAPYHDTDPNEMATFHSNSHFANVNFLGYKNSDGSQITNIQGKYSYFFSGNDYNYNSYVGGANTNVLTSLIGKINSTDPSEVYINLYVCGFGTPNTALNVALYELDSLSNYNTTNILSLQHGLTSSKIPAPYALNTNNNDVWQIEVPINWIGWQLVSLRYNQFRKHNTLGDFGNHVMEPKKLGGIALELDSYPALSSKTVTMAFDYVTVTEGGTFSVAK